MEDKTSRKDRRRRRRRSILRYLLPVTAIPILIGLYLAGLSTDRELAERLDEVRSAWKPPRLAATAADDGVAAFTRMFSLSPPNDEIFWRSVGSGAMSVKALSVWLQTFAVALARLDALFPPDGSSVEKDKVMLNLAHDPKKLRMCVKRAYVLAQLECIAGSAKAGGADLLSLMALAETVACGMEGRRSLEALSLGRELYVMPLSVLIELVKRQIFSKEDIDFLGARLDALAARFPDPGPIYRDEFLHRAALAEKAVNALGAKSWLLTFAFIENPSVTLEAYAADLYGSSKLQVDMALRSMHESYTRAVSRRTTSAAARKLLDDIVELHANVMLAACLARGLLQMMQLERFRLEKGRYPSSLDELAAAGGKLYEDPLSAGRRFGYIMEKDVYQLYSAGFDGVDNGGNPAGDIVLTSISSMEKLRKIMERFRSSSPSPSAKGKGERHE